MTDAGPMTLITSLTSPFGRKVRMAASILGLAPRIRVVHGDTRNPDDPLRAHNPLGKIPVLIAADGSAVYDSHVILELLDLLAGGDAIIPAAPGPRIAELTRARLADGIIDASLLITYEGRYREPSQRSDVWLDHQRGKLARALTAIAADLPPVDPPRVSAITLACALDYMDWREPMPWRGDHPDLVAWLDAFAAAVPAFAETARPAGS